MSTLVVRPHQPDEDGNVLRITPESAGWRYVGFEVYRLLAGQSLEATTGSTEVCLVLLSGRAAVRTRAAQWSSIGERTSVFDDTRPYSVYVPAGDEYCISAETELELAVCRAPGSGDLPARLIGPDQVTLETRGYGSNQRKIQNILPDTEPADSLLVVEVFTPDGHWSSYPPHKHDQDALPEESFLEETYYHRLKPPQGFAFQRVYTDDRSLDETMAVQDGEVVMVPRGYHPVAAPPGYDLYYLNVMAGPRRLWKFNNDPDHDWVVDEMMRRQG